LPLSKALYHTPVALTIHLLLIKWKNFHQCNVRNVQKSDCIALFRHLTMFAVRPATLNWQYGQRTRLWCPLVALWRHRRLTGVRIMVKSVVSLYCFTWDNILFFRTSLQIRSVFRQKFHLCIAQNTPLQDNHKHYLNAKCRIQRPVP